MTIALNMLGLSIRIGARMLVERADCRFGAGEVWAILGRNGAGKTLLLHTLAGLRAPDSGQVEIAGRPLSRWPAPEVARQISLLLQDEPALYWGSTLDYVMLGRLPHRNWWSPGATGARVHVEEAMARYGLDGLAQQPYRTLSGGERQRARLAQLATQDTPIILMDEPLNHLDLAHQRQVLEQARLAAAAGRVVVFSVHDPVRALPYCSHAVLMYDSGRMLQGSVAEVITRSTLESLYECPVEWAPTTPITQSVHR